MPAGLEERGRCVVFLRRSTGGAGEGQHRDAMIQQLLGFGVVIVWVGAMDYVRVSVSRSGMLSPSRLRLRVRLSSRVRCNAFGCWISDAETLDLLRALSLEGKVRE